MSVRPNPIATPNVNLVRVMGSVLEVRGLECLDGTPLVDLAPYRCDSPATTRGATQKLVQHTDLCRQVWRPRQGLNLQLSALRADAIADFCGHSELSTA